MSYYVEYNPEQSKQYPVLRKNIKKVRIKNTIILLMVVGLIACFAHRDVREFLIPGDATATVYATTELLEEIKEGTPMLDAFAAFCQTVAGNES